MNKLRVACCLGFTAVLIAVSPGLASARDDGYNERTGLWGGFGLGVAEGNFDLETENDEADQGFMFDAIIGWAFTDRFALSAGVSVAGFAYETYLGGGDIKLDTGRLDMTFLMGDVSGWYFLPVWSDVLKLYGRVGIGTTTSKREFEGEELESEDSVGVVASAGLECFLSESFALTMDIFYRTYGVKLQGLDDEVATDGLTLNAIWR